MLRFVVRMLLSVLIFTVGMKFVFGAHYYGHGTSEALFLSLMMVVAAILLGLLYYLFIIGTLGIGMLIAVPLRLIFGWLVPTLQLMVLSRWYPESLQFESGLSVVIVGLIFYAMHEVTEKI